MLDGFYYVYIYLNVSFNAYLFFYLFSLPYKYFCSKTIDTCIKYKYKLIHKNIVILKFSFNFKYILLALIELHIVFEIFKNSVYY